VAREHDLRSSEDRMVMIVISIIGLYRPVRFHFVRPDATGTDTEHVTTHKSMHHTNAYEHLSLYTQPTNTQHV
jgi:hypothetical protein